MRRKGEERIFNHSCRFQLQALHDDKHEGGSVAHLYRKYLLLQFVFPATGIPTSEFCPLTCFISPGASLTCTFPPHSPLSVARLVSLVIGPWSASQQRPDLTAPVGRSKVIKLLRKMLQLQQTATADISPLTLHVLGVWHLRGSITQHVEFV